MGFGTEFCVGGFASFFRPTNIFIPSCAQTVGHGGGGGGWGWGGGLLQGWVGLLSGAGRGGRGVGVGCGFSLCCALPAPRTLEESSWDGPPQRNPVLSYGNRPPCLEALGLFRGC